MNDNDQRKQMARNAMAVQNLQLIMIAGMVLGFIAGAVIGAYLLLPIGGWGIWAALASPIIGIFVGQRVALMLVAR